MNKIPLRAAIADYRHVSERIRAEFPDEDEVSLRDTIEGCTYLDEAIAGLLREAHVIRTTVEKSLREIKAEMTQREARLNDRADRLEALAMWATQEAGWRKIGAPDFTASIVTPKHGKVITPSGVAGLPGEFVKQKLDEYPDKKAINAALERGDDVGDAYFEPPRPYWTIRR
jgi:hypothetical protein